MAENELSDLRVRLGGRYHVERLLGRGGMGAVYLARELQLDRLVALKVLPSAVASDVALRDRFLRETRLAASFSHPNIVPVYMVEEQPQLLAFAMGFVEGQSLAEQVKEAGPLTARQVVRLLQDAAYALAYAHSRGVVHRDIKPDNLMIERATGRALVMDFGIARRVSGAPTSEKATTQALTRVGEVVGTPEYMSPEQAVGDVVDGRSDLYSLGLVAWFALTGRPAISGDTTQQVLVRQLTEALPSIASARPDLPAALVEVIDRCVAKEPSARFADAAALVEALEQAQLVGPEIPLPVRLLANDLGTISMIVLFTSVIAALIAERSSEKGDAVSDVFIPVVVLGTIVLARFFQVLAEIQRLARMGFDGASVLAGLTRVVDEAEGVRAAARVDAERLAERRSVVRTAWVMLVIGLISIAIAWSTRVQLAPGRGYTPPLGMAFLFNSLGCICAAFVLWLRSPFRMSPDERFFRLFWLRGPGAWLIARIMRRGARARSGATVGAVTTARVSVAAPVATATRGADGTAPSSATASLDARVRALETRVDALEGRG